MQSRGYSVLEIKVHVQGYLTHKKPELEKTDQIWALRFLNLLPEGDKVFRLVNPPVQI